MNNLDNIIDTLKELRQSKQLKNLDDNTLFENAVKLFISANINDSKDKRVETMSAQKLPQKQYSKEEPITLKQLNFLKKNKYTGNLNITKKEAKEIISDFLNSLNQENI